MDSINREQPEPHRQDLEGSAAVARVRETVKKTESCFFCTDVGTGGPEVARPMSVQAVDDDGTLWFLSASDSHKNQQIERQPAVQLFFQGSEHSGFMTLNGSARITRDQTRIDALWKPIYKTWFTEGRDDPRITAVAVRPDSGYYWDNQHGDAVAGLKMLVGAAIGRTLDDSLEGALRF
jgi:general stress protein 26